MKAIWSIFRFVFIDGLQSKWAIAYLLFFALSTYALIYFTGSFTRSMVSIMNIVILVSPLVSTMMTSMYYFNKSDFLQLMLTQPVSRTQVFLGMYLGLAIPQVMAVSMGLLLGMSVSISQVENILPLFLLMLIGAMLSLIFCALSMLLSAASKDRLMGVGLALFTWLFMAIIYDGCLLLYFLVFSEYPIEQHAILLTLLNPIDLSRVFVMLQLDISSLLGYSGAVFQKFFGTTAGIAVSLGAMGTWILSPLLLIIRMSNRKDF